MNRTTKTILIVGGVVLIALATKKYWYKPKATTGTKNNLKSSVDELIDIGKEDVDEAMNQAEELENVAENLDTMKSESEKEMAISMGGMQDNSIEISEDSMGGLINSMGSPAEIMNNSIQESVLKAKSKNLDNPNTPNFTPKMPTKEVLAKAKVVSSTQPIKNSAIQVSNEQKKINAQIRQDAYKKMLLKNDKKKVESLKAKAKLKKKVKTGFSDFS